MSTTEENSASYSPTTGGNLSEHLEQSAISVFQRCVNSTRSHYRLKCGHILLMCPEKIKAINMGGLTFLILNSLLMFILSMFSAVFGFFINSIGSLQIESTEFLYCTVYSALYRYHG